MSNTSSDKSFDKNSSDSSDDRPIVYFKPDQLQLVYNGYIYNRVENEKNRDDTVRLRCSSYSGCAIKTKENFIIEEHDRNSIFKLILKQLKLNNYQWKFIKGSYKSECESESEADSYEFSDS